MCKALHYACFALTKMSPSRQVLFLTCRVGGKDVVAWHWHLCRPSHIQGISFTQMLIQARGKGQRKKPYKALKMWGATWDHCYMTL